MQEININIRSHIDLNNEEMETLVLKCNFLPKKGETIVLKDRVFDQEFFTVLNVGYIQVDDTLKANVICMHKPKLIL